MEKTVKVLWWLVFLLIFGPIVLSFFVYIPILVKLIATWAAILLCIAVAIMMRRSVEPERLKKFVICLTILVLALIGLTCWCMMRGMN